LRAIDGRNGYNREQALNTASTLQITDADFHRGKPVSNILAAIGITDSALMEAQRAFSLWVRAKVRDDL